MTKPSPTLGFLWAMSLAVGPLAAFVYAAANDSRNGSSFLTVLAVGVTTACAGTVVGVLLGFLFGLPRTLDRANAGGILATNTNLDQISDWLTKILVGIGLVQLGKISKGLEKLASALAPGLGDRPGAQAFAGSLLVFATIDGFLVGYLWTRIVASRRLKQAAEDLAPAEKTTDTVLSDPPPAAPPPPPPPPPPSAGPGSQI